LSLHAYAHIQTSTALPPVFPGMPC
jgi:hypothetical protein